MPAARRCCASARCARWSRESRRCCPTASIHDGLAALKKDNRGYDLNQLLIGAEGTLGVVTAATLRLVPAIVARAVAWVGVAEPGRRAGAAAPAARRRPIAIESFEIMPGDSLALVLAHIPGTRAPLAGEHPWHVLIEAVIDRSGGRAAGRAARAAARARRSTTGWSPMR